MVLRGFVRITLTRQKDRKRFGPALPYELDLRPTEGKHYGNIGVEGDLFCAVNMKYCTVV